MKQLLCCGAEVIVNEPWHDNRIFPTFYQVSREECQTGYKATRSQVVPSAIRDNQQVRWEWEFPTRNEAAEWLLDNHLCK